jgi:hypothetical protein
MVLYWEGDSRIVDLPPILNPLVERLFLPVARLLGFRATYPSHRSAGGGVQAEAGSESSSYEEEFDMQPADAGYEEHSEL